MPRRKRTWSSSPPEDDGILTSDKVDPIPSDVDYGIPEAPKRGPGRPKKAVSMTDAERKQARRDFLLGKR